MISIPLMMGPMIGGILNKKHLTICIIKFW
jgi:hypothetical protein